MYSSMWLYLRRCRLYRFQQTVCCSLSLNVMSCVMTSLPCNNRPCQNLCISFSGCLLVETDRGKLGKNAHKQQKDWLSILRIGIDLIDQWNYIIIYFYTPHGLVATYEAQALYHEISHGTHINVVNNHDIRLMLAFSHFWTCGPVLCYVRGNYVWFLFLIFYNYGLVCCLFCV